MPHQPNRSRFDSPYLTRLEVAHYLRVTINTVDNLISRGVLTPHRVVSARRVLIHRDDVERAIYNASRRSLDGRHG
jgi:excisionase family DNA binding protein